MKDNSAYTTQHRAYFVRTAFVVVPLLALLTTTPIYFAIGNDMAYLPVVWLAVSMPLAVAWIVNYKLYNRLGHTPWKYYLASTLAIGAMSTTLRLIREIPEVQLLAPSPLEHIRTIPPIISTVILSLLNNTLIIVFQTLIRYRITQVNMVRDLADAQLQRVQAQYENLRNQIHPHFLFNALNTLRILIRRKPDQAEEYVLHLSSFLRQSLEASKDASFTLLTDWRLTQDYLRIQQVRFGKGFEVWCTLSNEEMEHGKVPILTTLTLVENALKHNQLSEDNPIKIVLERNSDGSFSLTNNVVPLEAERAESTGIGLHNLNERFKILGGKELDIRQHSGTFEVRFFTLNHAHSHH